MAEGGNFRVTCLVLPEELYDGRPKRVFATRRRFKTRQDAEKYAATVAKSRKPYVSYCTLETSYEYGHWVVYDPDGDETQVITLKGDRFDELAAVWDFCETFDYCSVYMYGVPCGGLYNSPDEAGSGYMRCNRCTML